jgi:hypothetical protein
MWRNIIDRKYCSRDNIFHSDRNQASPFWMGVLLAAQAVRFGYRWVLGNGEKVHFLEDNWFGTALLVVHF